MSHKIRIPKEDFVDHAPKTPGVAKVDHVNCGAGRDTRSRLYIWRRESGGVNAYCHNCGGSGFAHGGRRLRNSYGSGRSIHNLDGGGLSIPVDAEFDPDNWPPEAQAWAYSWVTREEVVLNRLFYSVHHGHAVPDKQTGEYEFLPGRVIIPVWHNDGTLWSYQARRIHKNDNGPKYLSRKSDAMKQSQFPMMFIPVVQDAEAKTVVICEDALSSIKVSRVNGVHAYAVGGVHLNSKMLLTLSKRYDTMLVWLDNDNPTVKRMQRDMRDRFMAQGLQARLILTDEDPKAYTTKQIIEHIHGALINV